MSESKEFDRFAEDYREIHTQNVMKISGQDSDYFSEYKIREIYECKLVPEEALWLDLGCGDGNTARFIKKFYPHSSYCGIDVSEESIELAKKKVQSSRYKTEFQSYDGMTIPYANDCFDVVFIACVLHHIIPEQREALLQECRRVLKAGGKIIIFEHNPYNPVTRKMVNTCPFDENAQLLSASYLKKLLRKVEFCDVRIKYTIFFPRKKIFKKLLGLETKLGWIPAGGQYYTVALKKGR